MTSGYDTYANRTSLVDDLASVGCITLAYDDALRLTTITRSLGGSVGPHVAYGYDNCQRSRGTDPLPITRV